MQSVERGRGGGNQARGFAQPSDHHLLSVGRAPARPIKCSDPMLEAKSEPATCRKHLHRGDLVDSHALRCCRARRVLTAHHAVSLPARKYSSTPPLRTEMAPSLRSVSWVPTSSSPRLFRRSQLVVQPAPQLGAGSCLQSLPRECTLSAFLKAWPGREFEQATRTMETVVIAP